MVVVRTFCGGIICFFHTSGVYSVLSRTVQQPKTSSDAKSLGNALLGQGKIVLAVNAYERALELLETEAQKDENVEKVATRNKDHAKAVLYSNIAACRLASNVSSIYTQLV